MFPEGSKQVVERATVPKSRSQVEPVFAVYEDDARLRHHMLPVGLAGGDGNFSRGVLSILHSRSMVRNPDHIIGCTDIGSRACRRLRIPVTERDLWVAVLAYAQRHGASGEVPGQGCSKPPRRTAETFPLDTRFASATATARFADVIMNVLALALAASLIIGGIALWLLGLPVTLLLVALIAFRPRRRLMTQ